MKKNKTAFFIVGICLIVVAILTCINVVSRPQIPMHSILVEYGNKSEYIDMDTLRLTEVTGEIINGKGEVKEIAGQAILLSDVLNTISIQEYDTVKVISDDEYSAELTKSEILDEDKVYLFIADDLARLYVFGDKNSKRNVSNVVKIVLQLE